MTRASKTKKPKTRKPKYEPLLKLPPLSAEEYEGLRASIAVSGVLVPILVDCDGPRRRVIDGSHRKQIANELGYDCPETVVAGLTEEDLRAMARALNLARRQLNTTQKRELISQQLRETPQHTNRLIAKMLGVSHPTVASVRADLTHVGKSVSTQERRVGADGKSYKSTKPHTEPLPPDPNDCKARLEATTLLHGEGRMKNGRPRPPVAERERCVDADQVVSTKESRYSTASTKSQSRAAIVKSIGLKFV